MLVPAFALLIGVLAPFAQGVWTSLTDERLYATSETEFVGLGNYADLLEESVFIQGLWLVVAFVALVLLMQIPLGMGVAALLNVPSRLQRIGRSVVVAPLLIPAVVAALIWKTMMQPTAGVVNWALGALGIGPQPWLSSPGTALVSTAIIDTWIYMPFVALILLAGMQSVPEDQMEAARVDGASEWKAFRHVTLRWLVPYVLLVLIFRTADAIKTFEVIYATTRGGPLNATRVLHIQAYEEGFRWANTGRAMAIVLVLWLIVYVVSIILTTTWRRHSGSAAL
jgi:multiple sugar transport system permease protein